MCDDPCTATLTFGLRGYGEAYLAQMLTKRLTHKRRLAKSFEETAVVIFQRRVTLGELLKFADKVGRSVYLQFIE